MVYGTWKCIALNVQHVIKNKKKCAAITTGHQWQHTCGKKVCYIHGMQHSHQVKSFAIFMVCNIHTKLYTATLKQKVNSCGHDITHLVHQ